MTNTSIQINPIGSHDQPLKKEVGQLSLDIYHKGHEIVIVTPIAGVDKEKVTLSITEDVLVIQGARIPKEVVNEENYYTKECFWGPFSRSIVLPKEAETDKISASFDNSVLEIRIPTKEQIKGPKIIKIKS